MGKTRARGRRQVAKRTPAARSRRAVEDVRAMEPWQWPETTWRSIVGKVRAGRSLKPSRWKDGARVAVALSFDSDHETPALRDGETSPGKLSQGQYGNRQGVPRILALLARHGIPATFFVPAVSAQLYPDEQRREIGRASCRERV